jgi:LuxR family maltose regulon positive regulatory protein
VQLAALSLQGCSTERAVQFIGAFSGSHHYSVDYLVEEVLSRQPDVVRRFLLQTSILDRMCAPLCDAVLRWGARGRETQDDASNTIPSAQDILERLEHANLFLVPLDDDRRWYRYHHLFSDVLRQMHSAATSPDEVAALHRRAAGWHRQQGLIGDAVHHALLAADHERAAAIIEESAWAMVRRGQLTTLRTWIQALPADVLATRPWLRVYYA